MKNLILALNKANLSDSDMESVLTDFENWIESKVVRSEQKMMTESIVPIQKENDGIRSEIRLLAETMKHGFEKMDQKLDFTRKNLEMQITSTRENLEIQIKANDKQLSLVQKLLWLVLTLVLGLFAKAVHLF
jgi:acetaldehyde dehydrogenase (acetylating)